MPSLPWPQPSLFWISQVQGCVILELFLKVPGGLFGEGLGTSLHFFLGIEPIEGTRGWGEGGHSGYFPIVLGSHIPDSGD